MQRKKEKDNEAEFQTNAFGDHVVQIDINGETTTITFEDDISLARRMQCSMGRHATQKGENKMKNSTEMKQKCGWSGCDVINEAELQASSFGDHVVQIDTDDETTTITFEDGSIVLVRNSDVEYL